MFINCILKRIVLALDLEICQFLTALHFLFPLLTHDLLLLLTELKLFRSLVWASHTIAHVHWSTVSIAWRAIWVVTRLIIRGTRKRWAHWVLLPRVFWLLALRSLT